MTDYRLAIHDGALRALSQLPRPAAARFSDLIMKLRASPDAKGINFETVQGARDKSIKSLRIDQDYRAIACVHDGTIILLHADKHDDAYRWAERRRLGVNSVSGAVEVEYFPEVEKEEVIGGQKPDYVSPKPENPPIFHAYVDDELESIGVSVAALPLVRLLRSEADLDLRKADLGQTAYDGLACLLAGYSLSETRDMISGGQEVEPGSFGDALETDASRKSIWVVDDDLELERVLREPLAAWRIFLHPDQRKLVERPAGKDWNGPVLVRGGAGTGKTVVAMHRAKWLAQHRCSKAGDRILFTTFTSNLAVDIKQNLKQLCPEHVQPGTETIEVKNLDAWVREFLKKQSDVDDQIVFPGSDKAREVWADTYAGYSDVAGEFGEHYMLDEWEQVIQAQGIFDKRAYLTASRAGRGTPIDRATRADLWTVFEAYRTALRKRNLICADDAYARAAALIRSRPSIQRYKAIVVDETQDMGPQALRLIAELAESDSDGKASIFLVGDAHQRIYNRRASMRACGIDVRGRSRQLKVNYRTSNEIRQWAVAILEGIPFDDLDEGVEDFHGYRSAFFGPKPEIAGHQSPAEEITALAKWIIERSMTTPLSDIGILLPTIAIRDEIAKAVKSSGLETRILQAGEADDPSKAGVRLATMHRAKGLEFRAVALPHLDADTFPPPWIVNRQHDEGSKRQYLERQRSLLHVAATRAKDHLLVSWVGAPSAFILNPEGTRKG
ncbi:UvrD-helicase domain-containing protein (plasmid) [Mesorhizobium muleiense]|uniref:UvrD-helicase domain-containing protein n=1 Tax=Mesorhizobium muleiense TaxID=1004279 RepID=UPI003AFA2C82